MVKALPLNIVQYAKNSRPWDVEVNDGIVCVDKASSIIIVLW